MRHTIATLAAGLLAAVACAGPPPATAPPNRPILIYLHGAIVEGRDLRPNHPVHGHYEYQQILDRFAAAGLDVRSEQRPAGAHVDEWAERTVASVRELVAAGTDPALITVVGFSKGGAIALATARRLELDEVGYVIIAGCPAAPSDLPPPHGLLLSLREASDDPRVGSCQPIFDRTADPTRQREVVLDLGGGHGAFFRPQPAWVDPVIAFARRASGGA